MPSFTDADGRVWKIEPTVPDLRAIKSELQVDLLNMSDRQLFARLVDDPELLVDCLSICLTAQIERAGLTAHDFALSLRGDVLDAASEAFLEGLVDFFPKRRRALLRAALAQTHNMMQKQTDHAIQILDGPAMEQILRRSLEELDREIAAISGSPSTSGSASPASEPTSGSPSAGSPGDSTESSGSAGTRSPGSPPPSATPPPAASPPSNPIT